MKFEDTNNKERSRRRFLKEGVALAGLAAVGMVRPGRSQTQAEPPMLPDSLLALGQRSRFETALRVQTEALNGYYVMTPLQDSQGIITPSHLHFVRRPGGGIPDIDPQQHRLMIHGLVERPLIYTVAELKRLPSVTRIYFAECLGNGVAMTNKDAKSIQDTHGRVSCSEWTGVPLPLLLKEAGLKKGASWLFCEGADGWKLSMSLPLEPMMDDGVLVAYAQNGEAVRPEQGYPLRLFVPQWGAHTHVKHLRRIKVGEQFVDNQCVDKWGTDIDEGKWRLAMPVKSVITFPCAGGQPLSGPGLYEISGLAWSNGGAIRRVEVSTDGGKTYQDAQLQEPVLRMAFTRFRLPWNWTGEETVIQSRATDETGDVQPTVGAQTKGPSGSLPARNLVMPWKVTREGKVFNGLI